MGIQTNISNFIYIYGAGGGTSFGTGALFLQFAFDEILNLVHFLLLLVQEVHDNAHGGLLQPNTFNLVLQSVLHVAQPQRGVDQNYFRKNTTEGYFYIIPLSVKIQTETVVTQT